MTAKGSVLVKEKDRRSKQTDTGGQVAPVRSQAAANALPKDFRGSFASHAVPDPVQYNRPKEEDVVAFPGGAQDPDRDPQRFAIVATHGMGQATPFGTLDLVLRGLERAERMRVETTEFRFEAQGQLVRVGTTPLRRAEFSLTDNLPRTDPEEPPRKVDVHVYEGYWAPIMEGHVKFRDVIAFVTAAATNGLLAIRWGIQRHLFGYLYPFRFGARDRTIFAGFLLLLGALAFLDATIAYLAGAQLFGLPKPPDDVRSRLTWPLLAVGVLFVAFGLLAWLANRVNRWSWTPKEHPRTRAWWHQMAKWALSVAGSLVAVGLIAGVLGAAGLVAYTVLWANWPQGWPPAWWTRWGVSLLVGLIPAIAFASFATDQLEERQLARRPRDSLGRREKTGVQKASAWTVWLLLAGGVLAGFGFLGEWLFGIAVDASPTAWPTPLASPVVIPDFIVFGTAALMAYVTLRVRTFSIQFLGDVAAYVQTNRLDGFNEIRKRVKTEVADVARAVYAARDDAGYPLYDGVVVLGHSLGSVISYDVLNLLINEDQLRTEQAKLRVVARTRLFVTLGSPLDKTAFFFANQFAKVSPTREALAAVVQPLIRDYKHRPFPWLNIHSAPWDVFAASLELYDLPDIKDVPDQKEYVDRVVCNRRDWDAVFPVAAHNMYWDNGFTWDRIHEALTSKDPPKPGVFCKSK